MRVTIAENTIFNVSLGYNPKLDDFTWFVSRDSYDLTQSTPCQFLIGHDAI